MADPNALLGCTCGWTRLPAWGQSRPHDKACPAAAFRRVATMNGHSAHARFCAESSRKVGYISRVATIPSPYAYAPFDIVWLYRGKNVIVREVLNARFEAFEVPASVTIAKRERDLAIAGTGT